MSRTPDATMQRVEKLITKLLQRRGKMDKPTAELFEMLCQQLVILESEIELQQDEIAFLQTTEGKMYTLLSTLYIMKWQLGKSTPDPKYIKLLDKLSAEIDPLFVNDPNFTKHLRYELGRASE